MILYHGSNQDIDVINLKAGLKYKDFGQGFYLTPELATAERMARKKAKILGGAPTIIAYEFDEENINPDIRFKVFPAKATVEWFRFIDINRDRNRAPEHSQYDIVKGPIADDGVVLQLTNYRDNILTAEEAAMRLQDKYLDQQYYFGTQRAVELLKKKESWRIN